jgi:hypothetical protein
MLSEICNSKFGEGREPSGFSAPDGLRCAAKKAIYLRMAPRSIGFLCALLPLLVSILGCQFAPKTSTMNWPWSKNEIKVIPDRILTVWTDTVLHQPNQPGIRGFGGRIYFYDKDDKDPVEVDGSFAVYIFDADDTSPIDQKPLRKYMFTPEQFVAHMSKSSIGPSYSVWLPWGEMGEPQRRLSLIARFEGRHGGTTISDPTIKMLPGTPPVKKEVAKSETDSSNANTSPVRLAGYAETSPLPNKKEEPKTENRIESIDLPPSFHRHLRGAGLSPEPPRASHIEAEPKPLLRDSAKPLKLQEDNDEEAKLVNPITTQVYDYRTRGRSRSETSIPSKLTNNASRVGQTSKFASKNEKRE